MELIIKFISQCKIFFLFQFKGSVAFRRIFVVFDMESSSV